MKAELRPRLAALGVVLVLGGCAGSGGSRSGGTKLEGAVFEIPVYEPSTVTESMGSKSGGDDFTVDGMSWDLTTSDSPEKVTEWYERKLPDAKKRENDLGETEFDYQPPGAGEHESVAISIKHGGFHIHEDVDPGKRK